MRGKVWKPAHGSREWLMLRHRSELDEFVIGASEAAALHGEHRFVSPLSLFNAKLAPEPAVSETNEAMERGNRLEPVIRDWAADKLETRLIEPRYLYTYATGDGLMLSTLDAVDDYSYDQGEEPRLVVEIKTYNREWDGVLPRYWYWQGVQQSICSGAPEIVWAVFDSRLQLHLHQQSVTPDEKNAHIQAFNEFMFWLKLGTPNPEWPASYSEVAAMYPTATEQTVDISDNAHLIKELRDVQFQLKELNAIEDDLKGKIAALMGEATVATVDGQQVASWKQQSRSSFDSKGFGVEHPELVEKYTKSSTFRVLRVKGEK